jgi:hypothetical protein
MKIVIAVQSEAFLQSAGVRIRYRRFLSALPDYEARTEFQTVSELAERNQFPADIYIFVKCFSPEALILMAHLRSIGKTVGQDIFDDYFSQYDDARLARFRTWLLRAGPSTHFAVCTTHRMQAVLKAYLPDVPITIVEDPISQLDGAAINTLVAPKVEELKRGAPLRVAWFGIGDNPFFPVGLQDLITHSWQLGRIRDMGRPVELTILTNARALNVNALSGLRRVPVPHRIREWSEEGETKLLRDSHVAFVPVGAQSFSRAKSLNRAVSALAEGCQVLSAGYPLYAPLDDFLYRSPEELASDVGNGQLRLRPETVGAFAARIAEIADPQPAALAFFGAAIAAAETVSKPKSKAVLCVLHGLDSPSSQHKLANRVGGLSVKTPFHSIKLNYNLRFEIVDGRYRVLLDDKWTEAIDPAIPINEADSVKIESRRFISLSPEALGLGGLAPERSVDSGALPPRLAVYPGMMRQLSAACRSIFPSCNVVVSDRNIFVPVEARA